VNRANSTIQTLCQVALWAIIAVKAMWLAFAMTFVGLHWQIVLLGGALLTLIVATSAFGAGSLHVGYALAWVGVVAGFGVSYFGALQSGPLTDQLQEQFRSHTADILFLLVATAQFFIAMKAHRVQRAA
jgi:hypothetical protein